MDKEQEIYEAIARDLSGESTEEDTITISDWLDSDPQHPLIYSAIKNYWQTDINDSPADRILSKLKTRIRAGKSGTKRIRPFYSGIWFKAAATVIIIVGISFFIRNLPVEEAVPIPEVVKIEKTNPRGQKSTIFLDDGSRVKLNSASRISYIKGFSSEERKVKLEGEAFFEVQHDAARPFIVVAENLEITAIGTSFNVNAYPDREQVSVSLAQGKVVVNLPEGDESLPAGQYLEPGQQAIYNLKLNKLVVGDFEREEILAWKEGIIYFKNAGLPEILEKLEYWYGVSFNVSGSVNKAWSITAQYDNKTLEAVLTSLSYIKDFTFKINNDEVRIEL